ncbi:MAG TPA: hypothetical protein PLX29_02500 [Anaerolineaceae bacterium]|mgnify:CR=1 FL=1|nr:hypothetical protein [Anaerolineaceae bacterium]
MMPDTSAYMVAGFLVIIGGVAIYVLWIFTRFINCAKRLNALKELEKEKKPHGE